MDAMQLVNSKGCSTWVRLAIYIMDAKSRRTTAIELCSLSLPFRFQELTTEAKRDFWEMYFDQSLPDWTCGLVPETVHSTMQSALFDVADTIAKANPPRWGSYDGVEPMSMPERVTFWEELLDKAMARLDAMTGAAKLNVAPPGLQLYANGGKLYI